MPPRTTTPDGQRRTRRRSPAAPGSATLPGLELPAPGADSDGIVCRQYGLNHSYRVDGVKFPGVSTIASLMKGDTLINYTGRKVAEAAVNHWEELEALPPIDRYNKLYGARWEDRDYAANRGTQVHKLGQRLAHGEEVEYDDRLAGHIEAYKRWLDRVNPSVLWSELVVANRAVRYCGRLDLVADLPAMIDGQGTEFAPARWQIDVKTGRTGIWPETALQTCGYANAEVFVDPVSGEERPMAWLGIERCAALWVSGTDAQLIPLYTGPEVWHYFQALAWLYWREDEKREWVGAAAEPVTTAAPF